MENIYKIFHSRIYCRLISFIIAIYSSDGAGYWDKLKVVDLKAISDAVILRGSAPDSLQTKIGDEPHPLRGLPHNLIIICDDGWKWTPVEIRLNRNTYIDVIVPVIVRILRHFQMSKDDHMRSLTGRGSENHDFSS